MQQHYEAINQTMIKSLDWVASLQEHQVGKRDVYATHAL